MRRKQVALMPSGNEPQQSYNWTESKDWQDSGNKVAHFNKHKKKKIFTITFHYMFYSVHLHNIKKNKQPHSKSA